ncbi:MAG: hypothetical protein LBF50_02050 [Azoarcus sp.]|nr:hypothetical protein [Azoarcus sp.]
MKHIPKCMLACLMSFVSLAHAGWAWPDFGSVAGTIASVSDTAVLKFIMSNIDIMGLIQATLKHVVLFFVASLPVLFCCRKYRWFKRRNPIWDKFTYLYYLYIPIVFMALGAVYGASSNVGQQASSLIRNELAPPVNRLLAGALRDLPVKYHDMLAGSTPEDVLQILRKMIGESLDNVFSNEGTDGASAFWQKLPESTRTFVVDICVDIMRGKLADITGLSRGNVKRGLDAIQKESFLNLIGQGGDLFGDYAAAKIAAMIASYRFFAMLALALTLCVPVADVLLARRGRRKTMAGESNDSQGLRKL